MLFLIKVKNNIYFRVGVIYDARSNDSQSMR